MVKKQEKYSPDPKGMFSLYLPCSKNFKGANIVPKDAYINIDSQSYQFGTQW